MIQATPLSVAEVARRVLRTSLDEPGWAHVDFRPDLSAQALRALLVGLGRGLDAHYRERFGAGLVFLSMGRFDQQRSTRAHRDGGPDASLLLLGYEPSEVPSRLFLLDYTKGAHARGQTPREFLDCCNPAFGPGAELLHDYRVGVTTFQPAHAQIVVINNSLLPVSEAHRGMLGVLHEAEVEPRPGKSRAINSVLMGVAGEGVAGEGVAGLSDAEVEAYVETGEAVVW